MSLKITNSAFPFLYIDKFNLQGIYSTDDTLIDDILKSNNTPKRKLIKAFLGHFISNAKEEKNRRGKKNWQEDIYENMITYVQEVVDCLDLDNLNEVIFSNTYNKVAEYESKELRSNTLFNIRNDIFELVKLIYKLTLVEEENCFKIVVSNKEDADWLTDFILRHKIELNTKQQNDRDDPNKIISDFIRYISEYSKENDDSLITLEIPERLKTSFKENYIIEHKGIELVDINEFNLCISKKNALGNLVGDRIDINRLIQNYIFHVYEKGIWGRFGYSYSSISSGEMTSLLIFKKIFDYFSSGEVNVFASPIIILLDEPNIALHPELERRFIYLLNKYTGKLIYEALKYSKNYRFKQINENKNIDEVFRKISVQYIITTHSPIMISDVPKSNIIFLDGKTDKDAGNQNKLEGTLANNIYEIMLNGMFVEKSIGEFSFEFIKKLGEEINDIEKNYNTKVDIADISKKMENAQSKIDIIGDIYIKKSIQSKLDIIKSKYMPEASILKNIRELEIIAHGSKELKKKACSEIEAILKRMREE